MAGSTLRTAAVLSAVLCMLTLTICASTKTTSNLYTETFRSPAFNLAPGEVIDKFFMVEMPKGHVALRSFDAQVVDEDGNPITLSETYLHHWLLLRFYVPKGSKAFGNDSKLVPNAGTCPKALVQWYGLGSETRRTDTDVPEPYGIVFGDPEEIPEGFEQSWVLNVHAIDTRGAVNVRRCTECVCALYNVTVDEHGKPLVADYDGGLECCRDQARCAVKQGFQGEKRQLFMEYTVKWVDMSDEVIPVKVFILDVTDSVTSAGDKTKCRVEYTVPKCAEGESVCRHKKESSAFLPSGGDVIYAVAHQHSGGVGSTLLNEDGNEICSSVPIYGTGSEPGNEEGYIVGMTTCYPKPGSVKVRGGEKLHLTSWYNSEDRHTGVMGLFYLLVAESPSSDRVVSELAKFHFHLILVGVTVLAAFVFIGTTIVCHMKTRESQPYAPI